MDICIGGPTLQMLNPNAGSMEMSADFIPVPRAIIYHHSRSRCTFARCLFWKIDRSSIEVPMARLDTPLFADVRRCTKEKHVYRLVSSLGAEDGI